MALNPICFLALGVQEIIECQFGITSFTWNAAQARLGGVCIRSVRLCYSFSNNLPRTVAVGRDIPGGRVGSVPSQVSWFPFCLLHTLEVPLILFLRKISPR